MKNIRIGTGFDAHCFKEGARLVLGGVNIPHKLGLAGHSDADVLLHSICDAILGALGAGDIGVHFPDTDPQYKDISSIVLLSKTAELLEKGGFCVSNIDSVIIAQEPKVSPYAGRMRENISKTLRIDCDAVNIKATTTEGMGFTGRKEGIACLTSALIIKKA